MTYLFAVTAGLGLGLGLLVVLSSFTPRRPRRSVRSRSGWLRRLLDEAGHQRLPTSAPVIAVLSCAVLTFPLVFAVTQAVPVAICFAIFASAAPWAVLSWQARRRRAVLSEVWPDAVDHLRSAIRSGLALPEGLMELAHTGPEPLRQPFAEFGRDWRAGVPFDAALDRLKSRLADPVADRIIMALQITRELGGTDLGRLLGSLAEVLRENARTRSELQARQSWTINGARLAVAAPWIVVLLLATQPGAAESYRGAAGMAVLGAGLAVSVLCYRTMLRIGVLPKEQRVLA